VWSANENGGKNLISGGVVPWRKVKICFLWCGELNSSPVFSENPLYLWELNHPQAPDNLRPWWLWMCNGYNFWSRTTTSVTLFSIVTHSKSIDNCIDKISLWYIYECISVMSSCFVFIIMRTNSLDFDKNENRFDKIEVVSFWHSWHFLQFLNVFLCFVCPVWELDWRI